MYWNGEFYVEIFCNELIGRQGNYRTEEEKIIKKKLQDQILC